jgi:L-threonylcarbamoyladenylate synthase
MPPTRLTDDPAAAAALVRAGRVVAFPTETVYGLGADAWQPAAVARIFAAKGRPSDNPLIVHVGDPGDLARVAARVPPAADALVARFFPGPLTVIVPKRPDLPDVVTAGLGTVGVRMPRHPVAQAFLRACGTPVAAPSANRSGRPSPTTWQAVEADLGGRIAAILRGGPSETGLESTVVDCTTDPPAVVRPGAVPLDALRAALPETGLAPPDAAARARSPGTRHRHYAPDVPVRLVATPAEAARLAVRTPGPVAYLGLDAPPDAAAFARVHAAPDVAAYARALFAFLRAAEADGCALILAQTVPPTGLGLALMDRLERAAAGTDDGP